MKGIKAKSKVALPIIIIMMCLFGFLFAPNDPALSNVMIKFQDPSSQYPFGTDEMGRCVLSRILWGGYITIGIVLVGSIIVAIMGSFIGLLLGQSKTAKSVLLDSVLNAITAIPPVAYLIIFIGIWGNSIPTMMVSLTASLILRMIKLVKTQTEIEIGKAYVMCAISCGASKKRILFAHVFPNVIRTIVSFLCLSCAEMVMTISGFSFIGLTLGDGIIDWGYMLSSARNYIGMRQSLLIYPVLFIFLTTLAFNVLGKLLESGERRYA
jgi:ABC-type dipeptide/oligopeptide/nickel transport system permease subunit